MSSIVMLGLTQRSLMYVVNASPRLTGMPCCSAASFKKQLAYFADHEKLLHRGSSSQYSLRHTKSHDRLSPTPSPWCSARPPRLVYYGMAASTTICKPPFVHSWLHTSDR